MAKATVHSLTAKEQTLVAETRRERLTELDEDALVELHTRVRRARDKYVGQHRREVARHVDAERARGVVSAAPRRSASKAEIFEDALARVSGALAGAARRSAAELRADRLAAARGDSASTPTGSRSRRGSSDRRPSSPVAARRQRPAERKAVAASRASGARRQAKRDAR